MSAHSRRTRQESRTRGQFITGPQCQHCGTERIVMPLSAMRGIARKHPALSELLGTLEEFREWYTNDQLMSLCPGCFCITGDLSTVHSD